MVGQKTDSELNPWYKVGTSVYNEFQKIVKK